MRNRMSGAGDRTGSGEGRRTTLRKGALDAANKPMAFFSFALVIIAGLFVLLVLRSHMTGMERLVAICLASVIALAGVVESRLRRRFVLSRLAAGTDVEDRERARADREGIEIDGRIFFDPFDIPASDSRRIEPTLYAQIFRIIEAKHGRLLEDAFADPQVRAVLLCAGEVVGRGRTPEEFDEEHVRSIEQERDRVCFIYGKEDLVEECAWSPVGPNDAYPTLSIWLGGVGLDESTLRDKGVIVVADFDTGNPRHPQGYLAFDDTARREAGIPPGSPGKGSHLGEGYQYSKARVVVGTADEGGAVRAYTADARFVPDWGGSPFVFANPARRGFLGREIMFRLGLRISLDPQTRRTRVQFTG